MPDKTNPARHTVAAILKLRDQVDRYLSNAKSVGAKPDLIFDDSRCVVTYFGIDITFDDISRIASGGPGILRVFAQNPNTPISVTNLKAGAGLGIDVNQFPQYLSRLRKILKKTAALAGLTPEKVQCDPRAFALSFIMPQRRSQLQSGTCVSEYKLVLPSNRVMYVPPK